MTHDSYYFHFACIQCKDDNDDAPIFTGMAPFSIIYPYNYDGSPSGYPSNDLMAKMDGQKIKQDIYTDDVFRSGKI